MTVPPDEVKDDLTFIEKMAARASSSDEYNEAILRSLAVIAKRLESNGEGTFGGADIQDLPIGTTGISTGEIPSGNTGTAVFNLNGTKVVTRVDADSSIDENEGVVVIGEENLVRPGNTERDKMSLASLGVEDVVGDNESVVSANRTINISNEVWVNKDGEVDPEITTVDFDGDLKPGDIEVVAKARDESGENNIRVKSVGVTAHKADIDGDNKDESVVRYYFQYYDTDQNSWKTSEGISGLLPIGSMNNPQEIMPDSFVDFSGGIRILMENRTDDAAFTDTTVAQDDLGGKLIAKAVKN